MSCVDLQYISSDECIGASLPKINGNFAALSAAVCELSSVPAADASINVFDSPTIDLDWNASTRTLSAVTTASIATSSSPMVAKAWACFTARNGGTSGNVFVYDDYGISAINYIATGRFEVVFSTSMPNRAYSVLCQYAENVTNGFTAGGSVAIASGISNSDFPTTNSSPDFTSSTNSGKTTAKVKVGYGNTTTSQNPTEAYIHVFSS